MKKYFQVSFKNDLGKIISEYCSLQGESDKKIALAILEEVDKICIFVDSIKNSDKLPEKLKEKYRYSKFQPRVYKDNGFHNCEELFFKAKAEFKEGVTYIGFYIPSTFKTLKQSRELIQFTKEGEAKMSNVENIEFYSVAYHPKFF